MRRPSPCARPPPRVLAVALLALAGGARAQQPLSLDFERVSTEGPTRPWNWTPLAYAPGATVLVDSTTAHEGRRSLRIARPAGSPAGGPHVFATYLPPLAARGRRVRVSGWIKSEDLEGRAYLTVQTWADFAVAASDTAGADVPPTAWTRYAAEIAVAPETETLVLTANLEGTGTAWFDGLTLEVDGAPVDALPIAREVGDDEVAWFARHAAPLLTSDPAVGAGDLDAVGAIVGDARIVALGESTHGTREFFHLKHRVLRYLVEEHGFRVFAIEDQQLGMERINAYVHGGPGTAAEAMRGLFGVWHTEEVRALITWLRAYNDAHPDDPLDFVGFDMQNPSLPIDSLFSFVEDEDPDLLPQLTALLGDYREAWRRSPYPQYGVSDSVRQAWTAGAEAAWRLVEGRRAAWLAGATTDAARAEVAWAVQNARVAAQAGRYIGGYQPDRDSAMAENLRWHLDRRGPGTRAVVWAHDSHVSRGEAATVDANYFVASMGSYLARWYGPAYRAFGLHTYAGTYTATRSMWGGPRGLAVIAAFPAPAGSLEEAFHRVAGRLGAPAFVADLRPARTDPGGRALLEVRPHRFVGYAAEDYGFSGAVALALQFDGLFFIDHTTGTRPLGVTPWPPVGE